VLLGVCSYATRSDLVARFDSSAGTGMKFLPLPQHLERNIGPLVRRLQQLSPTGFQDASDFAQMPLAVPNMFEHIQTQHDIETGIVQRQLVARGHGGFDFGVSRDTLVDRVRPQQS
jgi:hypothetical protein